jgi:TolB-like protein
MRAEAGRIVLMDFGTGRELEDHARADLAGTPLYLAPEVLEGTQATVLSDVYSLGVLLYHLVSGSYPVHARTVREARRAHERGERIPLRTERSSVPATLAGVIERAIEPDPERRYPSAEALGMDLIALKSRPRTARLAYAAGLPAASIDELIVTVGSEVAGRQVRSTEMPGLLSTGVDALNDVGSLNISSVERPVIAVLPFRNLGAEPDSEYFVDGLTDEIIRNLGGVHGLQVQSRTSSFAFKNKPRNLQQIADQLGATLIVEGSAHRGGNRLRISVQLVQVDGDILWADRFDRELRDIFSIQDEISRAIVTRLRLTLARGKRRDDTNLDAYDLYLKARALVDRRGIPNAQKAAELFERAIAMDPAFAAAHAGLANAYAFMSFPYRGVPYDTAYPIMRPAAIRALHLDSLLAEAHAAMGWVYSYEHDWANATQAFQQAIRLNPTLTQSYTSYSVSTLQPLGKYDEALRLLHVAARYDPLSLDVQREIGEVLLFSGRYTEAVDTFHRVNEVEPDFPFLQAYLGKALAFAGRADEAVPRLELEQGSPWLAQCVRSDGPTRRGEEAGRRIGALSIPADGRPRRAWGRARCHRSVGASGGHGAAPHRAALDRTRIGGASRRTASHRIAQEVWAAVNNHLLGTISTTTGLQPRAARIVRTSIQRRHDERIEERGRHEPPRITTARGCSIS